MKDSASKIKQAANKNKHAHMYLDLAAKLHRLKTMDVFVLDNSLRETSVAQVRGHVLKDKELIAEAIQGTGIDQFIVASFGNLARVDDLWLQQRRAAGMIDDSMYAFSEMWDMASGGLNTIPSDVVPLGLQKICTYGIKNVILEIDLESGCAWEHFSLQQLFHFVNTRLEYIKSSISPSSRVFVNYRDACVAWDSPEARARMLALTVHLAALPESQRPFGLLFEDAMGTAFPWDVAQLVCALRNTMIDHDWPDGHLLIHVHKAYGLADAVVLESLACGCSGVWSAICCEGAMVGHASSLCVLTNLARLGNQYVQRKFNFPKLRQAAIKITEVSTNLPPHASQEIYGARALDLVFDAGGSTDAFNPAALFNEQPPIRVSTFTTSEMFIVRLKQVCDEKVDGEH